MSELPELRAVVRASAERRYGARRRRVRPTLLPALAIVALVLTALVLSHRGPSPNDEVAATSTPAQTTTASIKTPTATPTIYSGSEWRNVPVVDRTRRRLHDRHRVSQDPVNGRKSGAESDRQRHERRHPPLRRLLVAQPRLLRRVYRRLLEQARRRTRPGPYPERPRERLHTADQGLTRHDATLGGCSSTPGLVHQVAQPHGSCTGRGYENVEKRYLNGPASRQCERRALPAALGC